MKVYIDFMDVVALVVLAGVVGFWVIVWLYVKFCRWLEKITSRRNNKTKEEEE